MGKEGLVGCLPRARKGWSPCMRAGKKVSRLSKKRALFVNTEWEQMLQVPQSCTSTYVAQRVETIEQEDVGTLLRLEQESIGAVVMLVAHKTLQLL